MEPRISIITLGVQDLERSFRFYCDGLGLPVGWGLEKSIVFFETNGTKLALYPYEKLALDVSEVFNHPRSTFPGFALAHNVRRKDEVAPLLERAQAAGGKIEKPAHDTFWGGHSGYFSDPDGYLWEVAYGAFDFNEDGSLKIV
ncbi:MAG: VOC family protein [Alphaproteobacteria bacterium]